MSDDHNVRTEAGKELLGEHPTPHMARHIEAIEREAAALASPSLDAETALEREDDWPHPDAAALASPSLDEALQTLENKYRWYDERTDQEVIDFKTVRAALTRGDTR